MQLLDLADYEAESGSPRGCFGRCRRDPTSIEDKGMLSVYVAFSFPQLINHIFTLFLRSSPAAWSIYQRRRLQM